MTQPFQTVSEVLLTLKSTGLTVSTAPRLDAALEHHTDLGHVSYYLGSKTEAWDGKITFTTPNHLWNQGESKVKGWLMVNLNPSQWGRDRVGESWYLQITSNTVEAQFNPLKPVHPNFSEIQSILSRVTDTLLQELETINQALREGK